MSYIVLGIIHCENKEYDKAIKSLNKAKNIDPKDSYVYWFLGECYIEKKEYEKAISFLNTGLSLDLGNDNIVHLLILTYTKVKDYNNAFKISLSRTNNLIVNNLANNLKNIFRTEKDIPIKYKEILLKVYTLLSLLKIDIDSFKRENNNNYHLYQYRKLDFLKTVLESKSFWLNPTDYQNDPNEGKAFFDYINFENIEQTNTDLVAFISCFSALKDNLIMWDSSYAEDGKGISIGLDIEKISSIKDILAGININSPYFIEQKNNKNTINEGLIPINEIGLYKILYINLNEKRVKKNDKNKETKSL